MAFWQKQTVDKPLFPDLLWSRPENKLHAGKLLIIGGNQYSFSAPAEAYQVSLKAGVGAAKVLLPDALQKTVGKVFEAGEFAPSTPSGSFSQKALNEFLLASNWADGVLLAGDLGHNSETAILLEKFIQKYTSQLVITKDALDYFTELPTVLERPNTTLVASFAQLQKLAKNAQFAQAFTFSMDLVRLVETLHNFTEKYPINIVIKHLETMFVATAGEISTTKLSEDVETWRVSTAATASVWQLQNPTKPFEALTTAIINS